jgi:hypothetical protein
MSYDDNLRDRGSWRRRATSQDPATVVTLDRPADALLPLQRVFTWQSCHRAYQGRCRDDVA